MIFVRSALLTVYRFPKTWIDLRMSDLMIQDLKIKSWLMRFEGSKIQCLQIRIIGRMAKIYPILIKLETKKSKPIFQFPSVIVTRITLSKMLQSFTIIRLERRKPRLILTMALISRREHLLGLTPAASTTRAPRRKVRVKALLPVRCSATPYRANKNHRGSAGSHHQ